MTDLKKAAQQALEAWFQPHGINYVDFKPYMEALRAALAEPEQIGYARCPRCWEPITAPTPRKPQREHITDGSPCWCNPDVIEEDGGNVIVHNYDDNWQQYAKPGETAQQCIERHRAEQDALMKLYATPRKPLTDAEIDRVTDQQWAQNNHKPIYAAHRAYARAIERAHGIGEQA